MRKLFTYGTAAVIALLGGTALFNCGNDAAYYLVYIFSFLFIAFFALFSHAAASSKIIQIIFYALIMTAQILFYTLVIRTMGQSGTWHLYKLAGVLAVCVPFLVRINFFHEN